VVVFLSVLTWRILLKFFPVGELFVYLIDHFSRA